MADWLSAPGLTRQAFPQRLGWLRPPSIIVLHSTEGSGWDGYGGGTRAPHFTINARARQSRQHFPLSTAARALKAASGGHTNTGGAVQIELIGTCSGIAGVPSVLTFTDGDLAYIASILRAISAATGIPLTTSVRWPSYPGSYGSNGVRLGWASWNTHRGVVGHMHVPGNSHGDPGSLNIARLLQLAAPPTRDWFDMASRLDLIAAVREAIGKDLADTKTQATNAAKRSATIRNTLLHETQPEVGVPGPWDSGPLEDRITAKVLEQVVPAIEAAVIKALTASSVTPA